MSKGPRNPTRLVTITVPMNVLWAAHTGLYGEPSPDFPYGHIGGAYCPCPLARAIRGAEGLPEPDEAEVERHRAAVEADRKLG